MLGTVILLLLISIELVFIVLGFLKYNNFKKEKAIVRIGLFVLFLLLSLVGVIKFGFQWYGLFLLLLIQTIFATITIVKKKENTEVKRGKTIFRGINRLILTFFTLFPLLVFPQYKPIKVTGEYDINTVSYTLTDTSRDETFTKEVDNRKITIQFWYPSDSNGEVLNQKFPLVVFSHGAFGFRLSNYSTYAELASNGYVVVSIDHTYHAFYSNQEDGNVVIANMDFINSAMGAQNGDITGKESFDLEQEWMDIRTKDMSFVINHINEKVSTNTEGVYSAIDIEKIGLMGHSMGGATAAKLGRDIEGIDAVIVIDGTMLGEKTGFVDGKDVIRNDEYTTPLLNIYGESHYEEALKNKDNYPNMIAHKNGVDSYQVVINGATHMNFTDLPIVSPFLNGLVELEESKIDARECIETTNSVILEFFNKYLKEENIVIEKERTFK